MTKKQIPPISVWRLPAAFFAAVMFCAGLLRAEAAADAPFPKPAALPAAAVVVETRVLDQRPDRAIVLWMLKPEKHPNGYAADDRRMKHLTSRWLMEPIRAYLSR